MATITVPRSATTVSTARHELSKPLLQAFVLLRMRFTVAPILFGLDKFLNWLIDWRVYLGPERLLPGNPHQAMLAIGVVEIVAGVLVALRPKIGAYVLSVWLGGIIVNLLVQGGFYEIALRGFGLLLGALTLARLATAFDRSSTTALSQS